MKEVTHGERRPGSRVVGRSKIEKSEAKSKKLEPTSRRSFRNVVQSTQVLCSALCSRYPFPSTQSQGRPSTAGHAPIASSQIAPPFSDKPGSFCPRAIAPSVPSTLNALLTSTYKFPLFQSFRVLLKCYVLKPLMK